jgi:hypothetical protein
VDNGAPYGPVSWVLNARAVAEFVAEADRHPVFELTVPATVS